MNNRAQTAVDFGIAMGIFLVAVMTVVAFLPEMIEPFSGTPTENPLIADRVANQLIGYQLAGSSPGVLETTCTLYFFTPDDPSNPCPSFDSGDSLNEKLGIDELIRINVTVERSVNGDRGILCGDLSEGLVTEPPCDGGDEFELALGDSPPESGVSVSVARRGVLLDGNEDVLLFVRVWG